MIRTCYTIIKIVHNIISNQSYQYCINNTVRTHTHTHIRILYIYIPSMIRDSYCLSIVLRLIFFYRFIPILI